MKYTLGKNKILFVKPPDRLLEDEEERCHSKGRSTSWI